MTMVERDEQDASPARVGVSQEPKWFITVGIMPDGSFACDGNCLDDEMIARAILHKASFEMDRWFGRKAFERAAALAKDRRIIEGMMDPKKMKGMR
jgi:hypothetical protein